MGGEASPPELKWVQWWRSLQVMGAGKANIVIRGCHIWNKLPTPRTSHSSQIVHTSIPSQVKQPTMWRLSPSWTDIDCDRLRAEWWKWLFFPKWPPMFREPPQRGTASAHPDALLPTTTNSTLLCPIQSRCLCCFIRILSPFCRSIIIGSPPPPLYRGGIMLRSDCEGMGGSNSCPPSNSSEPKASVLLLQLLPPLLYFLNICLILLGQFMPKIFLFLGLCSNRYLLFQGRDKQRGRDIWMSDPSKKYIWIQ